MTERHSHPTRLTDDQIDELERRAANWLDDDYDIDESFDCEMLLVDALRNMLPLAIAELRAARET